MSDAYGRPATTNPIKDLLDAEVEIIGRPIRAGFDNKMQQTGVLLHVRSLADVKILKRAAVDHGPSRNADGPSLGRLPRPRQS